MSYTKDERETIIRTDESLDYWIVYTCSSPMVTYLRKIVDEKHIEVIKEVKSEKGTVIEGEYRIPTKCVGFKNIRPPRVMTDEQKKASVERLRKARENKK